MQSIDHRMKNFTISLYAFHLRNSLTDSLEEVATEAKNLWENLAELGKASLPLPELKNLRSHLICYDENDEYNYTRERDLPSEWLTKTGYSLDLGGFDTESGFKIRGNLQPFLLQNTYFADLTLFPETPDIEIQPSQLQEFYCQNLLPTAIRNVPLNKIPIIWLLLQKIDCMAGILFIRKLFNSFLGQTIWIYGETDKPDDICESLAKSYAVSLLEGSKFAGNLRLVNQGQLFGSLLFEYEAADPEDLLNLAKKCHILVWINNKQSSTLELAETAYNWMRDLLWSRHKMIYVYQQSRNLYGRCRKISRELKKEIKEFFPIDSPDKNQQEQLSNLLQDLPENRLEYSDYLRDLKLQLTGFKTNAENYQICLNKIDEIGNGKESEVWQNFLNFVPRWQKQIEIDLEYLEPGKELFDRAIETANITGILQAQRTRSLEKTIKAFGVGLSVTGIFTACYLKYADVPFVWPTWKLNTIHPLVRSIFSIALFAAFVIPFIRWYVNRKD